MAAERAIGSGRGGGKGSPAPETKRANMIILQGECIGGGSVVNNAVCFRMPAEVQREWEEEYGLDLQELSAE